MLLIKPIPIRSQSKQPTILVSHNFCLTRWSISLRLYCSEKNEAQCTTIISNGLKSLEKTNSNKILTEIRQNLTRKIFKKD